jgi:hypothetical protein
MNDAVPPTAKAWSLIKSAGLDALSIIKRNLNESDPLRRALLAVVVFILVSSFVALAFFFLSRLLLDAVFIITTTAILALLIALIFEAAYPGADSARKRSARRVLSAIIGLALVFAWTVQVRLVDLVHGGRFYFEYARLVLGSETLQSFATNATQNTLDDQVDSLERFVTTQHNDRPPVPGMNADGTLSQGAVLRALTTRRHLKVAGALSVQRPWQKGTIVLAADTVEFDQADLNIGRYDLVVIANGVTVKSWAHIRAFDRRPEGSAAPTGMSGEGVEGLDAGDAYLIVLNHVEDKIDIDLRGEDGGPGAGGQDGRDVPNETKPKALPSDGVGEFREVTVDDLKARREKYNESTREIRAKQDDIIKACGSQKNCIIPECTRDASSGPRGKDAEDIPAEKAHGRRGGAGGAGGHLYVYIPAERREAVMRSIHFDAQHPASGGHGGSPGRAGRGGRGGSRQAQGLLDPWAICSQGKDGPPGADGKSSTPGEEGPQGRKPVGPDSRDLEFESLFGEPID